MAALHTQGEVSLKERFFRDFQREVIGRYSKAESDYIRLTNRALQEQMEHLSSTSPPGSERSDAIDQCLAGIDRLSHDVKDAASYIPAYDQRTYSQVMIFPLFRYAANECRRSSRFQRSSRRFATRPIRPKSSNSKLVRLRPLYQQLVPQKSGRQRFVLRYLRRNHRARRVRLQLHSPTSHHRDSKGRNKT
jgi:hypothetical protein